MEPKVPRKARARPSVTDRLRLLLDKGVLAERVVGNGEGWLTTLSTTELRDLLTLEQEAIGD